MPPRGRASAITVAHSSRITHGLRSAAIVIPRIEKAAGWQRYHDAILDTLDPDGPLETALAARVAELLWRLRRIARAEQEFIAHAQELDNVRQKRSQYRPARPEDEARATWSEEEWKAKAAEAERKVMAKLGGYGQPVIAEWYYPDPVSPPRLVPPAGDLDQLIRYEAHLNRQLNSALHELEARQERRKGNPAPLARVAVSGLPGS